MGAVCTLQTHVSFWWYNDVYNQSVPKVAPFGGTSFVCYLLPLTPPLIKCCEFPRCDPFFEIIHKLSLFWLFRHAALYPVQVAFKSLRP